MKFQMIFTDVLPNYKSSLCVAIVSILLLFEQYFYQHWAGLNNLSISKVTMLPHQAQKMGLFLEEEGETKSCSKFEIFFNLDESCFPLNPEHVDNRTLNFSSGDGCNRGKQLVFNTKTTNFEGETHLGVPKTLGWVEPSKPGKFKNPWLQRWFTSSAPYNTKENLINFLQLKGSMLQPSFLPNSTCLHVYMFWHSHCAVCTKGGSKTKSFFRISACQLHAVDVFFFFFFFFFCSDSGWVSDTKNNPIKGFQLNPPGFVERNSTNQNTTQPQNPQKTSKPLNPPKPSRKNQTPHPNPPKPPETEKNVSKLHPSLLPLSVKNLFDSPFSSLISPALGSKIGSSKLLYYQHCTYLASRHKRSKVLYFSNYKKNDEGIGKRERKGYDSNTHGIIFYYMISISFFKLLAMTIKISKKSIKNSVKPTASPKALMEGKTRKQKNKKIKRSLLNKMKMVNNYFNFLYHQKWDGRSKFLVVAEMMRRKDGVGSKWGFNKSCSGGRCKGASQAGGAPGGSGGCAAGGLRGEVGAGVVELGQCSREWKSAGIWGCGNSMGAGTGGVGAVLWVGSRGSFCIYLSSIKTKSGGKLGVKLQNHQKAEYLPLSGFPGFSVQRAVTRELKTKGTQHTLEKDSQLTSDSVFLSTAHKEILRKIFEDVFEEDKQQGNGYWQEGTSSKMEMRMNRGSKHTKQLIDLFEYPRIVFKDDDGLFLVELKEYFEKLGLSKKGRIYQADSKCMVAFDSRNVELSLVECLALKWISRSHAFEAAFDKNPHNTTTNTTINSKKGDIIKKHKEKRKNTIGEISKIERRCKEWTQMKSESCRLRKVSCRFPNGFPFGDPESQPIPPLPPSQAPSCRWCHQTIRIPSTPESVEVPGLSNQDVVLPQRTRSVVNYQIPSLLGIPEIENFTGVLVVLNQPLYTSATPAPPLPYPGASQDPMILEIQLEKGKNFKILDVTQKLLTIQQN
ncbi:hypothetical protein VP01_1142g3 [Puccinia sorghi]|uniref:Uncharacterized protein n=1 Tax=Puccinia sorghi TaxID=27349 RepID=A0A0L6VRU9_9BASI|nr:hypothetical protein VP01_1142g3 [Puccinia sorghi]